MKKSFVFIVLLPMIFMSGCEGEQNTEVNTEVNAESESTKVEFQEDIPLKKHSEYYVLRVVEDSYIKYRNSQGYMYVAGSIRSVSLLVEDLETHGRVYLYLETDTDNISEGYKRIVGLVEGDKFKYLGNYDYEIISSK